MVEAIRMLLSHIPEVMFIAALAAAFLVKHPSHFQSRLLGFMLLLSAGVEEIWADFSMYYLRTWPQSVSGGR